MSKRKKRRNPLANLPSGLENAQLIPEGLSKPGLRLIAAGVAVVVAGFLVLTQADSMGRNWASHLSPFLILGGYAIIGFGIVAPGPEARPKAENQTEKSL